MPQLPICTAAFGLLISFSVAHANGLGLNLSGNGDAGIGGPLGSTVSAVTGLTGSLHTDGTAAAAFSAIGGAGLTPPVLSTDVGISAAAGVGSRPLGGVPHGLLDPGISVGVSAAELNLMADIQAHLQAAMTLRDLPPAPERTPPAQPQPISSTGRAVQAGERGNGRYAASGQRPDRRGCFRFDPVRGSSGGADPCPCRRRGGKQFGGASPRPASTLIRPTVVGTTQ